MDNGELERLLADYYRMCAEAGIEPLPDDETRGRMACMEDDA